MGPALPADRLAVTNLWNKGKGVFLYIYFQLNCRRRTVPAYHAKLSRVVGPQHPCSLKGGSVGASSGVQGLHQKRVGLVYGGNLGWRSVCVPKLLELKESQFCKRGMQHKSRRIQREIARPSRKEEKKFENV